MIVTLIVVFVIALLLFVPFKVKLKFSYDVIQNKGTIAVYLISFRLFLGTFWFKGGKLVLQYSKNKIHQTDLKDFTNGNNFMDNFVICLFKNIKFNTLKFIGNVGCRDDAFVTAMLVSSINVSLQIGVAQFLNQKPTAKVITHIYPSFCATSAFFAMASSVSLNLYVVIMSAIISLFKLRKGESSYENKSRRNSY